MKNILMAGVMSLVVMTVQAEPYKLKDRILGDSTEKACADSPVENQQERVDAFGIIKIYYPAQVCKVNVGTVANLQTSEPLMMVFWRGELIRAIVRFEPMSIDEFTQISFALMDAYGKSKNTLGQFPSSIWRKGDQEFMFERSKDFPTNGSLYLTQVSKWREYQLANEKINKAIEIKKKKMRVDDLKN